MTGLPGMTEMRSQNEPGLSIVTLVFTDDTPVYFARQLVAERLGDVREPPAGGHHPGAGAGLHGAERGLPVHARASGGRQNAR